MGQWGTGLYASDEAVDLRDMVKLLLSAPLTFEEIVDRLADFDDDHDLAALILADRMERRGFHDSARYRAALDVIEEGRDLARLRDLGLPEDDVLRRGSVLDELAQRLRAPRPEKLRKARSTPQPLLMRTGQIWRMPHKGGRVGGGFIFPDPVPSGWRLIQVIDAGHLFDVFSWYRLSALEWTAQDRPTLQDAAGAKRHRAPGYGIFPKKDIGALQMELLGDAPLPDCYWPTAPDLVTFAVMHGIGVEKWLNYGAYDNHGPLLEASRRYQWDAA